MFCKVSMIGYVNTDKSFNEKGNVMTVGIAYSGTRKSLVSGKYESILVSCRFINETAQRANKMIHKGDLVHIDGRLDISDYEKNGEKRKYTSIVVGSFSVLKSNSEKSSSVTKSNSSNKNEKYDFDEGDGENEPLPF